MNANDEFMDVDGPEFIQEVNTKIASIRSTSSYRQQSNQYGAYSSANTPNPSSYNEIAVVDTNFLLSNLGTLNALLDVSESRPGNLLVIVPWQVILELDGLKSKNLSSESNVGLSARKAMKFMEINLRNKKYAIRGQRSDELFDPKSKSGGDDAILDCCLYFQQLTGKPLTLLSNDRNLCIKVMIHGVDSLSAESKSGLESLLNRVYQGTNHQGLAQQQIVDQQQQMNYRNGHLLASQANQTMTEDVDMDVDGDELYYDDAMTEARGSDSRKWAVAEQEEVLVAPSKGQVVMKDYSSIKPTFYSAKSSWSSIHAPK